MKQETQAEAASQDTGSTTEPVETNQADYNSELNAFIESEKKRLQGYVPKDNGENATDVTLESLNHSEAGEIRLEDQGEEEQNVEDQSESTETTNESESDETQNEDEKDNKEDEVKISQRVRTTQWQAHERLAADLKARNPELTLEKALSLAKETLGIKEQETAAQKEALPTVKDIDSEIEKLEAELDKQVAENSWDVETNHKLHKEIRRLEKEKSAADRRAFEESRAEHDRFTNARNQNRAKAVELYPDLKDKNSDLYKQAMEVWNGLKEAGDTSINREDADLVVARTAARMLSIPPATVKKIKPSQNSKQPGAAMASSGGSRSTSQPANVSWGNANDMNEYEAQLAAYNKSRRR